MTTTVGSRADSPTTSSGEVSWLFEIAVNAGKEADFRAPMAEMSEATHRDEPRTLNYEWYVSDDGRQVHVFKRYADSDAVMIHLTTFGERYMARLFDAVTPQRMMLYGAPDDRVRGALSQLAPEVLAQAAGFSR